MTALQIATGVALTFLAAILRRASVTFDQVSEVVGDETGKLVGHMNNLTMYGADALQENIVEGLRVVIHVMVGVSLTMIFVTTGEVVNLIRWFFTRRVRQEVQVRRG